MKQISELLNNKKKSITISKKLNLFIDGKRINNYYDMIYFRYLQTKDGETSIVYIDDGKKLMKQLKKEKTTYLTNV